MADLPPNQQPVASGANPTAAAHPDEHPVRIEAKAEDAETRAAREELKHTAISDSNNKDNLTGSTQHQQPHDDNKDALRSGTKTPDLRPTELLIQGGVSGDKQVASPKKKRAHDEVESSRDNDGHRISSGTDSSEGGWVMVDDAAKDEIHRSEPQKKRARDETSPPADIHKAPTTVGQNLHPLTALRMLTIKCLGHHLVKYFCSRPTQQGCQKGRDICIRVRFFRLLQACLVLSITIRFSRSQKECLWRWCAKLAVSIRIPRHSQQDTSSTAKSTQAHSYLWQQRRVGTISLCNYEWLDILCLWRRRWFWRR